MSEFSEAELGGSVLISYLRLFFTLQTHCITPFTCSVCILILPCSKEEWVNERNCQCIDCVEESVWDRETSRERRPKIFGISKEFDISIQEQGNCMYDNILNKKNVTRIPLSPVQIGSSISSLLCAGPEGERSGNGSGKGRKFLHKMVDVSSDGLVANRSPRLGRPPPIHPSPFPRSLPSTVLKNQ